MPAPEDVAIETPEPAVMLEPTVKAVFDASCAVENGSSPESQLLKKLEQLSQSQYNYQIVERGPIDLQQSIFFGLHRASEHSHPRAGDVEVTGFETLLEQMTQANSGKIKGTVEVGRRLYPRATVEEYIFRTEDCAKVAEAYLKWVEGNGPWGGWLYKTPTRLIRNKKIIYHVISGGGYMIDCLPEIASALKPQER